MSKGIKLYWDNFQVINLSKIPIDLTKVHKEDFSITKRTHFPQKSLLIINFYPHFLVIKLSLQYPNK